ncbi:MAG TPA: ATP-binding protein [Rhizomicrobium sp.]|nr:ATP-binding protein [Rhizomicrobium sp.]
MSFRQRLVLFLVVTLVSVQALTAFLAYASLRHDLVERGKRELASSMGVFTRQLDFLSERVSDDVHVLSLDFALRSAIAQHDYGTELSALRNHGHRIGATRMMIVGLDGRTTADTSGADSGLVFPYSGLLQQAAIDDKATALATMSGQIYWIVVVPVRAPVPIAFIAACIPVNDALLRKLGAISSTPSAVVLATLGQNGHWMIAAESATHLRNIDLPSDSRITPSSTVLKQDGKEYLTVTAPLKVVSGSAPVIAVMDYSLDEALAAQRGIFPPMLAVLLTGLLAMVAGATLIARGVSRPLEMLAAAARRIATGDYTPPPALAKGGEVGDLGEALVTMTASISQREQALREAIGAMEIAKDEAVSANKAKSQFLSNMSHELRTPLNAIVGFSEMIHEQVLGPVGVPRYADYARDIHGAGQHLLLLVERMLGLAEAEANRLVIRRERLAPGARMAKALEKLKNTAAAAAVLVTCTDDPLGWPAIDGDAEKLDEAFFNILHNAIRFTPANGSVTVSGCDVDGRLVIRIADSGIGMEPDLLASVVRPFHRLRSAFDGKHQGAGLGLPFAKVIVELHGGALSLESRPGRGTTVTIALPVAGTASKAA